MAPPLPRAPLTPAPAITAPFALPPPVVAVVAPAPVVPVATRGPSDGILTPDYTAEYKRAKDDLLADFEREYVQRLLLKTGGNKAKAARMAGLDRKHLARLARRHGVGQNH
jgi:DNA-binding NtrC family response regulator